MRVDELQRGLRSARDDQLAADGVAGRHGVDRYVRRARAQRTGLAALIVLVLVSAGVFLATRGSDEQRVISGPGGVPHYLPDPMPAGPVLFQEYPVPAPPDEAPYGSAQWVVWTNDSSDAPNAQTQLLRLSVSRVGPKPGVMEPTVTPTSRGFRAGWTDETGNAWSLDAVGVTREDVDTAQQSAVVGADGRLAMTVPAHFREVSRRSLDLSFSYPPVTDSPIIDPESAGFVAAFEESRYPRTSFSAFAAPRSDVWALATSYELQPIEVRGQAGYLMRRTAQQTSGSSGSPITSTTIEIGVDLIWWETDNTLLSVTGKTEAEARALAESMRRVDDGTWEDFVLSTEPYPAAATSQTFSSSDTAIATPTTVP